jgi:adenine/guanine phosphoribosyltransferase-like PRPP-binding protein
VLKPANLQVIVDTTAEFIEKKINRSSYDCIAFQGMSGALVAPCVALKLGKPCVPVRKGEYSHSDHNMELIAKFETYLILDDLISVGKTCRAIIRAGKKHGMRCTGIVLYNETEYATSVCDEDYINQFVIDPMASEIKTLDIYCVGWLTDYVPYP